MDATTAVSSYFPQELISGILSQLPVKALLRFLCVSKQWNSIIADPDFMKIHLKCYIENNRDRTIIIDDQISPSSEYFSIDFACMIINPVHPFPPSRYFYSVRLPNEVMKIYPPFGGEKDMAWKNTGTYIMGCCDGNILKISIDKEI